MIAKAEAHNCLDEQYCIQKEGNWEDISSIFPIIRLEMPITPRLEDIYEAPTQQQVSIKTSVENETKLVPMTKEKNNGSNEFTLTKEQAEKIGLPFIAGKYIFIELDGQPIGQKQEGLFVNDENANKLKELLGSDVKAGYYQKPITQTTQTTQTQKEPKWYENKWVIVAGCFAIVGISHSLSENSGGLNGFLSGFSKKKKSKKSVKKQKKDKLK